MLSSAAMGSLQCSALLAALLSSCAAAAEPLKEGDLLFQTSRSRQSKAIQLATHSKYSHVGILFFRGGRPYVFEAVRTVRYTPLKRWIARGQGGRYAVKRLKEPLSPAALKRLKAIARGFEGRPYDLKFGWSDASLYCSELVWKMMDRAAGVKIGPLKRLADFDLSRRRVREKVAKRGIVADEPMISPKDMFEAPVLRVVER